MSAAEHSAQLRLRIADANRLLAAAESEMEQAVAQLAPVLHGDKRMTSVALDRAFHKVKDARGLIAELERMLTSQTAGPRA